MSQINVNSIYDSNGTENAKLYGVSMRFGGNSFTNRIINGDNMIDQRRRGATPIVVPLNAVTYITDRFGASFFTDAGLAVTATQSTLAPPNFIKSLGFTVTTAGTIASYTNVGFFQRIEAYNVQDLKWGTADAKPATLSFWVRSSVTGTFGGAVKNVGQVTPSNNRVYTFTYAINAANTWEYKTITIPGDTTGLWRPATIDIFSGTGIDVQWSLGCGTDFSRTAGVWTQGISSGVLSATGATSIIGVTGATFNITGVKFESGTVATPFEFRDLSTELLRCQRYYFRITGLSSTLYGYGSVVDATNVRIFVPFPVTMAFRPSALEQTGTAADYSVRTGSSTYPVWNAVPIHNGDSSPKGVTIICPVASGLTVGQGAAGTVAAGRTTTSYLAWSAEL